MQLLALYSLLVSLAVWFCLLPFEFLRVLLGRSCLQDLRERLGRAPAGRSKQGCRLLFHAVSAGEVNVAGSILKSLLAQRGDIEALISVGNRAGQETGRRLQSLYPQVVGVVYLPWDRRGTMRRWLERQQPDLVCVVETEIWPNLFHACRTMKIPLYVVNGRVYGRDLFGYELVRPLMREVLSCADWLGVQSESERRRFLRIGASPGVISVVGNAKFEPILSAVEPRAPVWSHVPPGEVGLAILAACTHAPEETWVLHAYSRLRASSPGLRLILAPRDVGRCGRIARSLRRAGFRVKFWSEAAVPLLPGEILIVDKMGVLAELYALADVVFVGGSLVGRGGHNLLEPASRGKPIVIGPYSYNFADVVERFAAAEALIELDGAQDLVPCLELLLLDATTRQRYGEAARRACLAGHGPASRYAAALSAALANRGQKPNSREAASAGERLGK